VDFPSSTGFSSQLINASETSSEGFEASLSGTIFNNDNWNWDTSFIYNTNVSKIVDDLPIVHPSYDCGTSQGGAYSWEGDEIGRYLMPVVRIEDPNSGFG
jgi:outer membrane receptor protein involved in Fe transport